MKHIFVISLLATLFMANTALANNHISQHYQTVRGNAQEDVPATKSWRDFEKLLKNKYVGTYTIYGTLPDSLKKKVYRHVKQGGSIKQVREYIVQARLNRL